MTCRIMFVEGERCFQEGMHEVREVAAQQVTRTEREAAKRQGNAGVDLEQQGMGLSIARCLRQQENGMTPIKRSDSMPIKKNRRFQLEEKRIISRGIPMQLQDQGEPLQRRWRLQRHHQPACALLAPPELSDLTRWPLR